MSDEGIKINAYLGSFSVSAMGKRKMVLDIPEDQAVQFLASQTLYGRYCELTINEIKEGAE